MKSLSFAAVYAFLSLTALPRAILGRHIVDDNNYYDDKQDNNYYYDDGSNNDDQWFAEKAQKTIRKVSIFGLFQKFKAYKTNAPAESSIGSLRQTNVAASSGFVIMNENACAASSAVTSTQVNSFTAQSPSVKEPSMSLVYKVNRLLFFITNR
jgi:hypothetical protein